MGRRGLGLGLDGAHLVQLDEPVSRTGHDLFLVGGQRTHCSVVTHQPTNVGELAKVPYVYYISSCREESVGRGGEEEILNNRISTWMTTTVRWTKCLDAFL